MSTPEPAAYESLERRLDEVLGPDDAGTLKTVLSSLATKDDVTEVKDELALVKDELALVKLDVADFKNEVGHGLALVRTEMHGTKHEIIGAFRGELNAAITAQTRPLLVALVGTAIVFAGSLLGAVQLA